MYKGCFILYAGPPLRPNVEFDIITDSMENSQSVSHGKDRTLICTT